MFLYGPDKGFGEHQEQLSCLGVVMGVGLALFGLGSGVVDEIEDAAGFFFMGFRIAGTSVELDHAADAAVGRLDDLEDCLALGSGVFVAIGPDGVVVVGGSELGLNDSFDQFACMRVAGLLPGMGLAGL
jgi:hypothetical protein